MRSSRSHRATRLLGAAAALVAAAGLAGCSVGVGSGEDHQVSLLVTRDFGRVPVGGGGEQAVSVPSSDTAMRILQRDHDVGTRYGGTFVQSIDGLSGGRDGARPVDWFFYVNGILADKSAAAIKPKRGDRIWWDRHDWGTTADVRAVVGSFPEPFLHGEDGKRYPIRLECADDARTACDAAAKKLEEAGVGVVARARVGTTGGNDSLRVLLGLWPDIRADFAAHKLEDGARSSGVFARPSADGRSIALLDARGAVVRRAGAGTGLIAAIRRTDVSDSAPVWLVTGVDRAGLMQAANGLTEDALGGKFAVAISDSVPTALPASR